MRRSVARMARYVSSKECVGGSNGVLRFGFISVPMLFILCIRGSGN